MNAFSSPQPRVRIRHQRGQTLIIALIILGVLLLLGFVFLGIINQNILSASRYQKRSVANDLSEAGIRYAQSQMVYGTLGADWRGTYTAPSGAGNFTQDPDALYLRPGSGLHYRADDLTQVDLGGPDGLGFYSRVNFENGRALVRVRYAPSDANIFSTSPTGALRTPGKAKNYLIIESVGRQGTINVNDPTSVSAVPAVQFQGFGSDLQLQSALATLKDSEKRYPTSRKEVAFASIGIIESALFITNKDHVSRAAEIGVPTELGSIYNNTNVAVSGQFGSFQTLFNFGTPPTPTIGAIGLGGSIYSNADLVIHGNVNLALNASFGDSLAVNGNLSGADASSTLTILRNEFKPNRPGYPAGWYGSFPPKSPPNTPITLSSAQFDSRQNFTTEGSVIRDGVNKTDADGYSRSVSYKAPPSILTKDPATGALRYASLTRDSGDILASGNSGQFGYGEGVYVDNVADSQIPKTESGRAASGSSQSLIYDWLNPNNNQANTGWQGPYYVPYGAYLKLTPDGFTITRDNPAGLPGGAFWKAPDGTVPLLNGNPTNASTLRYRLGRGADGRVHIINSFTPGIGDINGAVNYNLGPVFNGVLYFEGNVRVRGVIATDVQLTVASNATIYVEGSITKGVVGNDVNGLGTGTLLTRPTKSSLMLMAKDYVAINTTQFFGPGTNGLPAGPTVTTPDGVNPVQVQGVGSVLALQHEFLLDPNPVNASLGTVTSNPSTWKPYDSHYTQPGQTVVLPTLLLLSHAMDTGSAAETFLSLSVNNGVGQSPYLFPLVDSYGLTQNNGAVAQLGTTYIEPGYSNPGFASVYGLGSQPFQRFAKFESIGFPLVTDQFTYTPGSQTLTGLASNPSGLYNVLEQSTNDMSFRVNSLGAVSSNAYLLGRAAAVPGDVRIEAAMYAEEGSFFVIPGPYFNPNSNDSRLAYGAKIQEYLTQGLSKVDATTAANQYRLTNYGSFPESPFYGEPIDVKITIVGAVSENMTPPISQQAEYLRKWGWIPVFQGALNRQIPESHQIGLTGTNPFAPNLIFSYDPALATGRSQGFSANNGPLDPYLRTDDYGRPLPPMPRLPVSPTLAYFGEENF